MTKIATAPIRDNERQYLILKWRADTAADDGIYDWSLNEIDRLREAVKLLLPHALYLLTQMEDGLMADPSALRLRINKARAALGEGKE